MTISDWSNLKKFIVLLLSSSILFMVLAVVDEREVLLTRTAAMPDFAKEKEEVKETIKQFNSLFMNFYSRGGNPQDIDYFPANITTKRETFKDLIYLKSREFVMVYDLMGIKFKKLDVYTETTASATTAESWVWAMRKEGESLDQKPLAMVITVDYQLNKKDGKWMVFSHSVKGLVKPK